MVMQMLKRAMKLLSPKMEHHANIVPWQQLAKRKMRYVKFIPMTADGELNIEGILSKRLMIKQRSLLLHIFLMYSVQLMMLKPLQK